MNLAVVGGGYVGLVTAAVFAQLGHRVIVVDIDKEKIFKLKRGEVPFYEPGLNDLVKKELLSNRLFFTDAYSPAISSAEIVFICVGTPTIKGRADLSFLFEAVRQIATEIKDETIVVIKSTVPPGTNEKVEKLMKRLTKSKFYLASVPEFLREGKAIYEALHPQRIIIGSREPKVARKLRELYKGIPGKRFECSPESAQLIKYASNAFLATKISFINSISILCDALGANVDEVINGLGMDKRIGREYLNAGLGYGGSCFPKDVAALIDISKKNNYNFQILKSTVKTNEFQINYFVNKAIGLLGGDIKGKVLTILGLSFKPGTSDMREARSIYIIKMLKEKGAIIRACDPAAVPEAKKIIKGVDFFINPYEALAGAEGLLLVTEWDEYKSLDFNKIKQIMKKLVVIDGRNIYSRKQLENLGFIYGGIGR